MRPIAFDSYRFGPKRLRFVLYAGAWSCQACRMAPHAVKPLRIWLVGFGTVGQWLVRALDVQAERPYGVGVAVVGLANARDGFIYDENGLDVASALALAGEGRSIAELSGARCLADCDRRASGHRS